MATGAAVGSCISVCFQITQLLVRAKHNKKETESLGTAVDCINSFLRRLPKTGLSDEGVVVLGKLRCALQGALALLQQVDNTGPLMALLTATFVRDEFMRVNRDLMNVFHLLASGEKLLDLTQGRADAVEAGQRAEAIAAVERELSRSRAVFFVTQEQVGGRLMDIAAAAHENGTPEQLVHQQLLDQLARVPEVVGLSPQELLGELQALQLAAMYDCEDTAAAAAAADDTPAAAAAADDASGAAAAAAAAAGGMVRLKGKKLLGQQTEEFLVQQLCAALAPRAAPAGVALSSAAGATPPDAYLCPINQSVMVNPVIVVETGQTFEESAIRRWLSTHSTCPATNKRLTSKALIPNYILRHLIHAWAQEHGVRLQEPNKDSAPHLAVTIPRPQAAAVGSEASGVTAGGYRAVDLPGSRQGADGSGSGAGSGRDGGVQIPVGASVAAVKASGAATGPAVGKGPSSAADMDRAQGRRDQGDVGSFKGVPFRDADSSSVLPLTGKGISSKGKGDTPLLKCSRTKWAVCLIVGVVLVMGAVGGGVGAFMLRRQKTSAGAGAGAASPASTQPMALEPNTEFATPWGAQWNFVDNDKDFTRPAAANYCRAKFGGRLATVDSQERADFLVLNVLEQHKRPVYIGLTGKPLPATESAGKPTRARELKREWVWDSGAPFDWEFWGKPRNATGFVAAQPDGYGPDSREVAAMEPSCVSAAGSSSPAEGWGEQDIGSWNDHPCSNTYAFVCETVKG